ncbi:MAG: efflux RND transporter periplasmic adaptor subunit [Gemmatimonadota bacterium]
MLSVLRCFVVCLAVFAIACDRGGNGGAGSGTPQGSTGQNGEPGQNRAAGEVGARPPGGNQGGSPGGAEAGGGRGGPGGGGGPGGRMSALVLGPDDVMEVKPGTIEESILISGDLKPIEEIVVRARIEGDVTGVYVREGDRVVRGALLARFESTVQEGERESAVADREAAKSDVANAQWNADQAAELYKAGAIPERDVRAAQQTLAAAQARLAATEARLRAAAQSAQDTRITAPTNGVIATRTVENGEHVARGATMFTLVRNDILELEAGVPARQAGDLKVGQAVRFASAGRQMEGRVARVSPTINPANRSITVYVQVPNRDGSIKGNSFATGRIIGRTLREVLLVPNAAVRQAAAGDRSFVYRLENDLVQQAPVTLGVVDESVAMTQVLDGLAAGDRIIVGNVGALGAGMRVRVVTDEGRPGGARRPTGVPGEQKKDSQ